MNLKFDQMMRLFLLISGIVFFAVGVWMIKAGISAEGSIDIRSELLSGTIKTGSAGLFVTFFSFFMILASVLFSKKPAIARLKANESSSSGMRVLLGILFTLYAITIGSYLIARSAKDSEQILFGFLTAGFGFMSALFSLLTFWAWIEDQAAKEKAEPAKLP